MMETAQKVDQTILSAVTRLQNGEKPIILVDNTSDNIMAELQAEQLENGEATGRPLDIKDPDALWSFNKLVTKEVTHQETNEETGEVTTYTTRELIHNENEEIIAEVEHIKNLIRNLPDMAGSPLDAVQKGIRDAGFTIDEITGRKLKFDYEEGKVVKRKVGDKGDHDGLTTETYKHSLLIALVQQGTALKTLKSLKIEGGRALIELESPSSIVDLMQAYGRVNRMGQLTTPEVEFIMATQYQCTWHRLGKHTCRAFRRTLQLTTKESNASFEDTLDLFNSVGDEVVVRYFKEHPEFLEILGFTEATFQNQEDAGAEGYDADSENDRSARTLLLRLGCLPPEIQEQVLAEIKNFFAARIEELNAENKNPLTPKVFNGRVITEAKEIFEGFEGPRGRR